MKENISSNRFLFVVKNHFTKEMLAKAAQYINDDGNDDQLINHLYFEYKMVIYYLDGGRVQLIANPDKIFESNKEREAFLKEVKKYIREKINIDTIEVTSSGEKINNSRT